MSDLANWEQWLNDNRELLIMLAAYEISPAAVIAQRAALQAAGYQIDTMLYANMLELANLRQQQYWLKLENESVPSLPKS